MSGFDAFDELVQEGQSQQRVGGKFGSLGPAWTRGEIEKPQGSKDMGGWTANVYTQEQQTRLGVDADGKKTTFTPKPGRQPLKMGRRTGGQQSLGPAWTQNKMEAPQGEKVMPGGWTAAIYTPAQQSRLGVTESGAKKDSFASLNPFDDLVKTSGPAWTRNNMEPPNGERNTNGYVEAFYDREQQQRLGVDQYGKKQQKKQQTLGPAYTQGKIEAPNGTRTTVGGYQEGYYTREQQVRLNVDEYGRHREVVRNVMAAPPKWVTGEMEAPRGVKDMGTWNKRVYDEEQQKRLNVDEDGTKIIKQQKKQVITRQVSFGEFDPFASSPGGLKRQLSAKGTNLFQAAVEGGTIDFNDFGNDNELSSSSSEDDSNENDSDDESGGLKRRNTYERTLAERKELKEYRSWEKQVNTPLPKGFKRDEYGNLIGSVKERVTSKWINRKWVDRDFVIEKDKIILLKKGDKKGEMDVINLDEFTVVTDISFKSISGQAGSVNSGLQYRYCRFKVKNLPPWGQKSTLLCQLGYDEDDISNLKFLRQELMHVL